MSSMLFGENFLSINSSAKFFRGLSLVRDQRSALGDERCLDA
jgi:hypothetical protein